jgi:hypothetical protein
MKFTQDPTVGDTLLAQEIDLKNKRIQELIAIEDNYVNLSKELQVEMNNFISEQGQLITDKSVLKYSKYFDRLSSTVYARNVLLKKDIEKQKGIIKELIVGIEEDEKKQVELKKEIEGYVDKRRKVFDLKSCMTCTPEMDIIIV